MIIIAEPYGDHSNRLFQAVHYEAYCLDRQIGFMNAAFDDMAAHYPALRQGATKRLLHQAAKVLVRTRLAAIQRDLKSALELDTARKKGMTFVGGFDFRAHDLTRAHQDYFIEKYAIDKRVASCCKLAREIEIWKSTGIAVVGVHMRRGDYQRFKGGRYYYSDAIYESSMRSIEKLIAATGMRTKFILFSNEEFSMTPGVGIDYTCSKNDWLTDHFLMSQCNFLVGPPSTFTLWASFMGKVPYHHILEPDETIALSSFERCIG